MDIVGRSSPFAPFILKEMLEPLRYLLPATKVFCFPVPFKIDNRVIVNGKVGKRTLDILEKFKALKKELWLLISILNSLVSRCQSLPCFIDSKKS